MMFEMKARGSNGGVKRIHSRFPRLILFLVPVTILFSGFTQDPAEKSGSYSLEEALKVIRLIDQIQLDQLEKGNQEGRNVVVSESELNSYIAYRIEVEQEDIMKELKLKLLDGNKIEGKIFIDLRGQNLPKVLKPQMTFYMGGQLEVEKAKVRLNLKDLFLENQRIQPAVLDLVIFIGSKIQGTESFSMSEWWDLPYGIKNIKTGQGKAFFYY